jgi:hypothetical protein
MLEVEYSRTLRAACRAGHGGQTRCPVTLACLTSGPGKMPLAPRAACGAWDAMGLLRDVAVGSALALSWSQIWVQSAAGGLLRCCSIARCPPGCGGKQDATPPPARQCRQCVQSLQAACGRVMAAPHPVPRTVRRSANWSAHPSARSTAERRPPGASTPPTTNSRGFHRNKWSRLCYVHRFHTPQRLPRHPPIGVARAQPAHIPYVSCATRRSL